MEATAGSAEFDVVALKVDDLGLAEDSEVLKLGLADRGAVVGNEHQLALTVAQLFLSQFVA